MLKRTRLLSEFGPYGPSLRGTTGFSVPLGQGKDTTFPYSLDPNRESERLEALQRRRARIRELAADWVKPGELYGLGNKNERYPKKSARHHIRPNSY